jgi:hypothetical protein
MWRSRRGSEQEQTMRMRLHAVIMKKIHGFAAFSHYGWKHIPAMFCIWCEKHSPIQDQGFVKEGCSSLQLESVKKHDTSKVHVQSAKAAEPIKSTPENRPIDKGIRMMNTAFDRLSILFWSIHAIAKQCRPFTVYVWQCKLDEKKGLDIGATYRTNKKCKEFCSFFG